MWFYTIVIYLLLHTALAETPHRPEAQHGLHDAGRTSTGGGPPRRGRGDGRGQAVHSKTEVGGFATRGWEKVNFIFFWWFTCIGLLYCVITVHLPSNWWQESQSGARFAHGPALPGWSGSNAAVVHIKRAGARRATECGESDAASDRGHSEGQGKKYTEGDLRGHHRKTCRKKQKFLFIFFLIFQTVVEEIQIKSADLGEIQKSGNDLIKALSGNAWLCKGGQEFTVTLAIKTFILAQCNANSNNYMLIISYNASEECTS